MEKLKVFRISNGFIVSSGNYFGNPVVITAKNPDEIDTLNVFSFVRCIYGKKRIVELDNKLKEIGKLIDEVEELKKIYEKVCASVDERTELDQETANMEWEMSKAIHQ
jgi:hypothetical protein